MKLATDWISCQREMPEYNERVLVCTPGAGVFIAELKEKPAHNEDWWLFDGDKDEELMVLDYVSNWMPLPKGTLF